MPHSVLNPVEGIQGIQHVNVRLYLRVRPDIAQAHVLDTDGKGVDIRPAVITGGSGVPGPAVKRHQLPDNPGLGDHQMGRYFGLGRTEPGQGPLEAVAAGVMNDDDLWRYYSADD